MRPYLPYHPYRPYVAGAAADEAPVTVASFAASDGTLPLFVYDDVGTFYYWGGQQRLITDFASVYGGYECQDVSWLDPAQFTMLFERVLPQGLYTSVATGSQFYGGLSSHEQPYGLGVVFGNAYGDVTAFSRLPSFAYLASNEPPLSPRIGRQRFMLRAKNGEVYKLITDGMVKENYTGAATYATQAHTRLTVGYERIAGTTSSPLIGMWEGLRVLVYPYLADATMEATAKVSFDGRKPIHVLGDSVANENYYYSGGGVMSKVLGMAPGYRYTPLSTSIEGGTSLAQFADRYELDPEHWGANLLIIEGGLDTSGVDCLGSLQEIVGRLAHSRWFIVEPVQSAAAPLGAAERIAYDAAWGAITSWATDHVILTHDALAAANDGSAGDLEDLANDVCPRSLRVDAIHLNPAGQNVYATQIKNALVTARWL